VEDDPGGGTTVRREGPGTSGPAARHAPRARGTVDAVTFDAGGTLFDMTESVGEVYAAHGKRHGADLDPARIDRAFVSEFSDMPPLAFPEASADEVERLQRAWWKRLVRAAVPEEDGPADFDAYFTDVYEHFRAPSAWRLFPEALPTLRALSRAGVRVGVVSNFDSRLDDLVAELGIAPWVEVVVCSSRAGAAKPDRQIFEHALDRLGVDPSRAVHVGDSLRADARGAVAVGMRAVLVRRARGDAGVTAATTDGEPPRTGDGVIVASSLSAVLDLV
jgi:putative hydrolase of the HAD superfamily